MEIDLGKEITKEEAIKKYPYLNTLSSDECRLLMVDILKFFITKDIDFFKAITVCGAP